MNTKINIVCFDINSVFDDNLNQSIDENKLALENPIRILDEFIESHKFLGSEKKRKKSSEIKYSFNFSLSNDYKISYEIVVLNNLSYIHKITSKSDACLVFINLENKNTISQLEKIVKYIIESCVNAKTYLIGIYKDKIIPVLNKETLDTYFEEENLIYEYYQIKCENYDKERDRINHKCIEKKNSNSNHDEKKNNIPAKKNKSKRKNNVTENNLLDIVEACLIKIYENKMGLFKEIREGDVKSNSNSKSGCNIF